MSAMARKTPQYKAVLTNLDGLQRTLQETDGAEDSLLAKFKTKGWLALRANSRADAMITKALSKIENKVENYEVFIGMLMEVDGIEDAVEKITGWFN